MSESEYVTIRVKDPLGGYFVRTVRFSDHPQSDRYRDWAAFYEEFEVPYELGHEEVHGNSYDAIRWVASELGGTPPPWVHPTNNKTEHSAPLNVP